MSAVVRTLNEEINEHTFNLYTYQEYLDDEINWACGPDILIIVQSPGGDLDEILKKDIDAKIVIWSYTDIDKKELLYLINRGICGYIYGDVELDEFHFMIKTLYKNCKYIQPSILTRILDEHIERLNQPSPRPKDLLSNREWEVLESLGKGYQNREIAQRLFISEKTVKNHVFTILNKLKVKDRTNAVLVAIKNKWIDIADYPSE